MASQQENGAGDYVAPVWFVSHGGPPTMFDKEHTAYSSWQDFGRELKREEARGMKGLVAVCAHWQSEQPGAIQVNTDETNPMVYDYYGFPDDYYKVTVQTRNPSSHSSLVQQELSSALSSSPIAPELRVQPVERGLDHGVFVPLTVALGMHGHLPSDLPLVQVSLPFPSGGHSASGSAAEQQAELSLALGRALRTLRTKHRLGVFASGMPVHNLRELGRYMQRVRQSDPQTGESILKQVTSAHAPYTPTFLAAAAEAVRQSGADADAGEKMAKALMQRNDYKQAHPSDEHFLPLLVAIGAKLPDEKFNESLNLPDGSLGWLQYCTASA